MNCGALILAASGASRLGAPKQLVRLRQEIVLDRCESRFTPDAKTNIA
jgi:hypothetical protein